MKILVFGAGVAGTIHAWVFEQAGHDVSLLVRPGHEDRWARGIELRVLDARRGGKDEVHTLFQPQVVTSFSPNDGYDLVIETVRCSQTEEALPRLVANLGGAILLLFNNNWQGLEMVDKALTKDRYVLGMHHAGGAIASGILDGAIEKQVVLGASTCGHVVPESVETAAHTHLRTVAGLFRSAGFKVEIQQNMEQWYWVHFAGTATWTGAAAKAGGLEGLTHSTKAIREALVAGREAMQICRARGVDVSHITEARAFLAPAFAMAPLVRRLMTRRVTSRVSQTSANSAPEFKRMYDDVIATGRQLHVATPHLEAYRPYVDADEAPGIHS